MTHRHPLLIVALLAGFGMMGLGVFAESPEPEAKEADSADKVLDEMLDRVEPPPTHPERVPGAAADEGAGRGGTRSPGERLVAGTGPSGRVDALRPEGSLVMDRRGRIIRPEDSRERLFLFDAERAGSPEPPMILLPCRLLERMEEMTAERGDRVLLEVSGRVYTYRGANYLMPLAVREVSEGERGANRVRGAGEEERK